MPAKENKGQLRAIVSIHDVMPHTLDRVQHILSWLESQKVPPVTLLVVPGRPWQPEQIDELTRLAKIGHPIAAHGWLHETKPRRLYHRLHAAALSRNVAEHLDLDSAGVLALLRRSRQWFIDNKFPIPDFYVPPAWALGPINQADLQQAPFKLIETARGLIMLEKPDAAKFETLPLTGYEADTALREFFLRRWNANQENSARRSGKALRISIHPYDLDLRVADQLESQIEAASEFIPYL